MGFAGTGGSGWKPRNANIRCDDEFVEIKINIDEIDSVFVGQTFLSNMSNASSLIYLFIIIV